MSDGETTRETLSVGKLNEDGENNEVIVGDNRFSRCENAVGERQKDSVSLLRKYWSRKRLAS